MEKSTFSGFLTDLIVPDLAAPAPRPQAFLVEQAPNWTLPTHFHQEHQFQVFVGGGGQIGRAPIHRLGVHFASPHSAYGPLLSGDEGVSYLTLRAVGDTGAWYLPEAREHLKLRVPKEQAHASPSTSVVAHDLGVSRTITEETIIAPRPSGLAAWLVRVPAGTALQGPAPELHARSGGRFHVVTLGSVVLGNEELPALSVLFASRDEVPGLSAGAQGLELLVLQFPTAAADSFVESMGHANS